MMIDPSRGEIHLDDLFNAIENDKDQVSQALDVYGDYLKLKKDQNSSIEAKIEILEQILQMECIEKALLNRNHPKERTRMDLKWTVLTECAYAYRKLASFDKALNYFEQAVTINPRVSTIHYEMAQCHLELGHLYEVKQCLEKTMEISQEHLHWKCLEQIICFNYLLGNVSKCLKYIRIGFDRLSTRAAHYDFGGKFLRFIIDHQPSMKSFVDEMFPNRIDAVGEEIPMKIDQLKKKLFRKVETTTEMNRRDQCERTGHWNFQEFGQYLLKKIRESKFSEVIDIEQFLHPTSEESENLPPRPPSPSPVPTTHRKKRSFLPLNIDDYEKRRSARSITRLLADDSNISTVEKIRRLISDEDDSSDEDDNVISPENNNDEESVRKEEFPSLHIDYSNFIQSIGTKIEQGFRYDHLDLIRLYLNELTSHASHLWSAEMRMIFTKFFECCFDHFQYPSTELPSDYLRACLCYVEIAIGSSRSDLSEDSIERLSCFARLKVKFKYFPHAFARLQFYLYQIRTTDSPPIDSILYRILWISTLCYFLSDLSNDALACLLQLRRLLPDDCQIILPNLFNHTTISRNSIENLYTRLKSNEQNASNSSQELSLILSRIAVAEEQEEFSSLIKRLEKRIFFIDPMDLLQRKYLVKTFETLVNVLQEKDYPSVRKLFDQILSRIIDLLLKMFDDPNEWKEISLKSMEKYTLNLIDAIIKRDVEGRKWLFKSINPWILLYRLTMKRDSKKSEQFLVSFVRTIHEFFAKQENCLINKGSLLEYFLLELIQLEHSDIRERLASKNSNGIAPSDSSDEQKSRSSKVLDEIEQCIYCLYGLVLRKSKLKNLNDHHCPSLELTLDKVSLVFYALRPRQLPGYEGRISVITSETESLFQRFESMIEWDDEREERRKRLWSFISDATSINSEGKQSDALIHLSAEPFKSKNALFEKDLYYLFADYYLKMSSKDAATKKAQEYYIKDLCLNTRRFDSWAGLTVIEFAKIEEFVAADDFDPRIFNVHMSASCFFRQAVSVDSNNHTLWMEYAEITYILQSYCSKYKEKSAEYVPDRVFLLNISKEAFEKANLCTDNEENKEDWTYLYMMAKIEEKLDRNRLLSSVKKYATALDLLHENKAVYPKKLGHQTSTSNSKGTLLGCYAVEMFYRIHASTLKYLNRHPKESTNFTIEQLTNLKEFLLEIQQKPFGTSFYEKSPIPSDAHSSHLIPPMYFPNRSVEEPWLNLYDQCVWLAVEGLYIVIARYNRHYRALYRLAHFFHSNEFYRHHRLSLELFLGGPVLELKNYPKIIGLYQERSKHNLFNGIWRIQPLEAERVGSFNASMYKCTRLFIELLLHFEEQWNLLVEVLRQLMEKPEIEKKYLREVERKMLCHYAIRNLFRTMKKKVTAKTREEIEREALTLLSHIDFSDTTNIPIPHLFELSIRLYSLVKNYPEFFANARLNELVELIFQRYRPILKYSNHLPEQAKAENLVLIYTPKKVKTKKRPTMVESVPMAKRPCPDSSTSQEFLGLASFLSNE